MAKKKPEIREPDILKDDPPDLDGGRHRQQLVAYDILPGDLVQMIMFIAGVKVGKMSWVARAKPGCKAQARINMHVTDGAAANAVPEPEDESATALAEEA